MSRMLVIAGVIAISVVAAQASETTRGSQQRALPQSGGALVLAQAPLPSDTPQLCEDACWNQWREDVDLCRRDFPGGSPGYHTCHSIASVIMYRCASAC